MLSRLLRKSSRTKKKPGIGMTFTLVMLLVLLLPVVYFLVIHPNATQAAWFDSSWQYRKKITLNEASVVGTTDFSNFPVLISVTDTAVGTYAQTDGDDIVFTDQNGTKLDHEIASYTTGTGVLVAWVRIPTLYAQQDTLIYMYYGNANTSSQQNVAGTWSSEYMAVWHVDDVVTDEATSATHKDSTLVNELITQFGNDEIAGQVFNAQQLDGNDSLLRSSDTALGMLDGADRVFSGWFYRDGPTTDDTLFARKNAQGASAGYMMWIDDANDDLNFDIYDGADLYTINGSDAITAVGWHHFAVVWDDDTAANTKVYIDGLDDTQSRTGTLANIGDVNATINFRIGAESDNGGTHTGAVDEYRMRSGTVTDEWIETEFNNQSAPGTFATVGSLEVSPGPIAFWKFDEGVDNTCSGGTNDACDASGGLNDLARSGATWQTEDKCVSGKCFYFDGSDDLLSAADSTNFEPPDGVSVGAWVKLSALPSVVGDQAMIAYKLNVADPFFSYKLEVSTTDKASFSWSTSGAGNSWAANSTQSLEINKWYYLEGTRSGATVSIYVNGILAGTNGSASTGSTLNSDGEMRIGASSASSDRLKGFIDELKIHGYARTAAQIKADYAARGSNAGSSATMGGGGGQGGSDNAQAFLTNGLTGYWKMDELAANTCTGGTNDSCESMGSGNDGAWNGGATTSVNGRYGSAVTFDGTDDYVDFGDPASGVLDPGSGSFTYSLWVKPAANVSGFDMPLYKGGSSAGNAGYDLELGSGAWNASVSDGTSSVLGTFAQAGTTGSWKMLTVVIDRDSKLLKLYMDGEQVDADSIAALGAINSTRNLRLGLDHSSAFDFNGLIDELRTYNRALSPAEVSSLYNFGPGPVVYYKLDENTGTTSILDSSTNSKTGTMNTIASTAWVSGKYGSALDMDGASDYINSATPSLPTGDFTYEAWVNLDDRSDETLFMVSDGGGGNELRISIEGSIQVTLNSSLTAGATTTLTTSTWQHVAVTRIGSVVTMYLDGIADVTTGSDGVALDFSTCDLLIGADSDSVCNGTLGNYLDGRVDDMRIYNYGRTAGQVIQDMNAGHPLGGSPVGSALGNWALDEQGGQTAYNQTNLYNMTLGSSAASDTNDPTWLLPSSCKVNGCLDFDGSDNYTEAIDTAELDITDTDDLTISGWFYRDTFTTNDAIISKRAGQTAAETGYIVYIDSSTDKLVFEISDGTDEYEIIGSTVFTSSAWTHFAVVFDQDNASTSKMYINGVEETVVRTGTIANIGSLGNSLALRIAAESDAGAAFDGRLDDIKVYKAVLSQENVRIDHNANASVNFGTKTVEANNLSDGAGSNPNLYFNFDENNASSSAQTITLDSTTHVSTGSATSTGTIPHNMGNNPNRMLVVATSADDASGSDLDITGITYNGQPLSLAIRRDASSGNFAASELWYLLNPPVGQYNVTVTFTGTVSNFSIGAMGFYNVRQDTPESTSQSTTGAGGVTTQTLATTVPNSMLVDVVTNLSVTNFTAGTSQTERFDTSSAAHGSAGSTKLWAVPGSPTMVQTAAVSTLQVHAAMAIAPAFDTTTVQDRSGSNLNGTLAGGMDKYSWTNGKYGSAFKFNGTSNYATVASPGFSTDDFTIEGWVNTTDTSGTIFQITDNDTLERDVAITVGEDGAAGAISGYIDATKEVESTTLINDGAWHHFAMTRVLSGGAVSLYIDGVLESTGVNTTALDIGGCSAIIGAEVQTTTPPCIGTPNASFYAGSLDEFKTFSYARTPGQIAYDYNRGKPIGWWKADECTGTTVYDSSGRGNNGVLTIGGTFTYTTAGTCNSGTSTHSWNSGASGKYNSSFALDGVDDWVDMGDIQLFDWSDTSDFSISGWFYRETATSHDAVVTKRNGISSTDDGFHLYIDHVPDQLIFSVSESGGSDVYTLQSTTAFTSPGWHHFVVVFDQDSAANTTMYIDGKNDSPTKTGTITNIGALDAGAADFRIGSESDDGLPFSGKIDDVRVYNYALSGAQARLIMNNGAEARFGPTEGSP